MSFTLEETKALEAIKALALSGVKRSSLQTDTDTINTNPFAEAQGLTDAVKNFKPSDPVIPLDEALSLVNAIDKAIASHNVSFGRQLIKGALSIVGTIKGVLG